MHDYKNISKYPKCIWSVSIILQLYSQRKTFWKKLWFHQPLAKLNWYLLSSHLKSWGFGRSAMRRTNKSYRLGLQPHFNSSAHSTLVLWKYRWAACLNSGSSRASGLNSITLHIKRKHIVLKTRVVLFFFFFKYKAKDSRSGVNGIKWPWQSHQENGSQKLTAFGRRMCLAIPWSASQTTALYIISRVKVNIAEVRENCIFCSLSFIILFFHIASTRNCTGICL